MRERVRNLKVVSTTIKNEEPREKGKERVGGNHA